MATNKSYARFFYDRSGIPRKPQKVYGLVELSGGWI
jgi:hypothetical protein